jgi:hypothetical protein
MAGKDRKLNSTVLLRDENGVEHTFGPDDKLPSWAVKFLDDAAKDAGVKTHPAFESDEA